MILNIKVSEAAKRTKTLLQIDGALCTVTGAGRNKVSGYYIRFLSSQWSAGIDGDFLREHCQGLKFFYQIYQATTRIFHITLIKFDEQHRSRVNLLHRTRGRLPYYWSSPSREEPAYGLISNVDSLCGRLGTASWIRIQQTTLFIVLSVIRQRCQTAAHLKIPLLMPRLYMSLRQDICSPTQVNSRLGRVSKVLGGGTAIPLLSVLSCVVSPLNHPISGSTILTQTGLAGCTPLARWWKCMVQMKRRRLKQPPAEQAWVVGAPTNWWKSAAQGCLHFLQSQSISMLVHTGNYWYNLVHKAQCRSGIQPESWLRIRKLEAQGPSNAYF